MATTNSPGVQFEYMDDGRLVPVVTGPVTDTVFIIGNAVDGPINTPVRVTAKNVESVFGPVVYNSVYTSPNGVRDNGKYNGNNLVKAYSEVVQGGCTDVIMMRLGDATHSPAASAAPAASDEYVPQTSGDALDTVLGIEISAKYPGTVYNGIGMTATWTVTGTAPDTVLTSATLTIRQDLKKKGRSLTYTINSGADTTLTKRELIHLINSDPRNFSIAASSVADSNLDEPVSLSAETSGDTKYWVLDGGVDGTRKDFSTAANLYNALMGWDGTDDGTAALNADVPAEESPFAKLETLETDVVYLSCLYADENVGSTGTPQSIAVPLAKALHEASKNDYPMVGVLGTAPTVNSIPTKVSTIVDSLIQQRTGIASDALTSNGALKMGYFVAKDDAGQTAFDWVDSDTNKVVDLGRYILLVAGPDVLISNPKLGQYVETGAGVYAGLLTTVPPNRATTNMQLPGVTHLTYTFTNRQLNKLAGGQPYDESTGDSGMGGSYVLFRRNIAGNIVINLDNTCAGRDSDYASYQVLYVVNMVASGLKKVVEPFIGMSAHATTKSALDNAVKKFLDYIAETRAIAGGEGTGYTFSITATGIDQLLGRINIELQLRPALQIKMINVSISVTPPTGA